MGGSPVVGSTSLSSAVMPSSPALVAPAREAMVTGLGERDAGGSGAVAAGPPCKGAGSVAFTLRKRGSYGAVQARVPPGASFKAEARAMLSAPRSVDVDCSLDGGVCAGCARSCLLKESCCLAVFRCVGDKRERGLKLSAWGGYHRTPFRTRREVAC